MRKKSTPSTVEAVEHFCFVDILLCCGCFAPWCATYQRYSTCNSNRVAYPHNSTFDVQVQYRRQFSFIYLFSLLGLSPTLIVVFLFLLGACLPTPCWNVTCERRTIPCFSTYCYPCLRRTLPKGRTCLQKYAAAVAFVIYNMFCHMLR